MPPTQISIKPAHIVQGLYVQYTRPIGALLFGKPPLRNPANMIDDATGKSFILNITLDAFSLYV